MFDWDDLRYFLAVADAGSTLAASRELSVSQSTVFRHIGALEAHLGVPLFERRASGYLLTVTGETLLPHAASVAEAVTRFAMAMEGEKRKRCSAITFSVPDVVISYVIPAVIGEFRVQHPSVEVKLLTTDRMVDLRGGEADVALRGGRAPMDPELFGRRLAYDLPALTASRDYARRMGLPQRDEEVAGHSLIVAANVFATVLEDWFTAWVPRENILMTPDNLGGALAAVKSGMGLAVLPRFLSDRDPDLVAASLILPIQPYELWIIAHERSRDVPAVRALMESVSSYVLGTTPKASQEAARTALAAISSLNTA